MSLKEMFQRTLMQIMPLLPYLIAAAVLTALVTVILLVKARHIWVNSPGFRWMGVFLGLSAGESCRLGCSWLKFILLIMFLAGFQKLSYLHYIMFLIPGLVYAVSLHDMARIPGRLCWLSLEFAGLLSCNLICGYIRDVQAGWIFWCIYILMAVFTALFGIYLFFTEVNDISVGRRANLDDAWRFITSGKGFGGYDETDE